MPKWLPWVGLGALFLLTVGGKKGGETIHGLTLTEDDISLSDWRAWMRWAPRAIDEALHDGAQNADQILAHLMRRAFPAHKWPPKPDDSIAESWREMVHRLNRSLRKDDADELDDNVIPFRSPS